MNFKNLCILKIHKFRNLLRKPYLFIFFFFEFHRNGSTTSVGQTTILGAQDVMLSNTHLNVTLSGQTGRIREVSNLKSSITCPTDQEVIPPSPPP